LLAEGKLVKQGGFWLSVEAIVCLALLGMVFLAVAPVERPSLLDLHLFKKENDLLLAWAKGFDGLSEGKMREMFSEAFPGKAGEMFVDGKRIAVGKPGKEAVAAGAKFFDKHVKLHELRVAVFK
jgi:hypothetical protein